MKSGVASRHRTCCSTPGMIAAGPCQLRSAFSAAAPALSRSRPTDSTVQASAARGAAAAAAAAAAAVGAPCEQQQCIAATALCSNNWLLTAAVALLLNAAPAALSAESAPQVPSSSSCSATEPAAAAAEAPRWRLLPTPPLADIVGFFDFGGFDQGGDQDPLEDPSEPFSLYGSTTKKYSIEKLQGEKILSRRRGFTVTTCVAGVPASMEKSELLGLSPAQRAGVPDDVVCRTAEETDLKVACTKSCSDGCADALTRYTTGSEALSGFHVSAADQRRVLKSCQRQCKYQCSNEGKTYDFVSPSRP